jgi:hypothetical protein
MLSLQVILDKITDLEAIIKVDSTGFYFRVYITKQMAAYQATIMIPYVQK